MHTLSSTELLDLWEAGFEKDTDEQASLLLLATLPDKTEAEIHDLGIGERDFHLLYLRQMLFGPHMINIVRCPHCNERMEWESDITGLLAAGAGSYPPDTPLETTSNGLRFRYRLPSSRDITAASHQPGTARQQLLRCCLLEVSDLDGKAVAFERLPETSLQSLSDRMEAADPLARIDIALNCPACEHQWQALFDIATFLWEEIHTWAGRTLRGVHQLAKTYGWTEADILAMTPTRRQLYLEMVVQ